MAQGLLGGLPPGQQGYYAVRNQINQEDAQGLQKAMGILAMKDALETRPMQQEQLKIALENARLNNQLRKGLLGGAGMTGGAVTPEQALAGGGGPTVANAAKIGTAAPVGAPQGNSGINPQIMGMLASGDPGLMAIGKAMLEQGKPVVNRGYGIGTMQGGRYVADPASLEQALAMERGKQAIELPHRAPVTMPAEGGQNVNVFPSEFPLIQAGGTPGWLQVPQAPQQPAPMAIPRVSPGEQAGRDAFAERLKGDEIAVARGQPSQFPASSRVLPSPSLGRIGVSQSQQDIISQQRQAAGGKALDEQFAKDYATFIQGGGADAMKQLSQLSDVSAALGKKGAQLSGPYLGSTPDAVLKFTHPEAIAMRERVEEVVQRSLRAILGAQFTEKEGERLIARAYNPNQPEAENLIRVNRLFTQLEQGLKNKMSAVQHFDENGTLEGWRGVLPKMADFDPEYSVTKQIGGADKLSDAEQSELQQLRRRFGRR